MRPRSRWKDNINDKVALSLCLIITPLRRMRSGGTAPRILNFGTRWR